MVSRRYGDIVSMPFEYTESLEVKRDFCSIHSILIDGRGTR